MLVTSLIDVKARKVSHEDGLLVVEGKSFKRTWRYTVEHDREANVFKETLRVTYQGYKEQVVCVHEQSHSFFLNAPVNTCKYDHYGPDGLRACRFAAAALTP